MLRFHLDGSVAISSETTEFIEAATAWMTETFRLADGARVLDLGCGPGLYASPFARIGADVTGIDFSARSIAHAREAAARAGLRVTYLVEDCLAWQPSGHFDLATMIMRDYCALAPDQRLVVLGKVERLLTPGGAFLLDVDSTATLDTRTESASYGYRPAGGFWSANPYFEFHNAFVYPDEAVTLDEYVIVEADRTRTIYNWIQFFSPDSLASELARSGLAIETVLGDVAGRPFDPGSPQFAVVARRA
jgi:SAM-dependent methyltransferase